MSINLFLSTPVFNMYKFHILLVMLKKLYVTTNSSGNYTLRPSFSLVYISVVLSALFDRLSVITIGIRTASFVSFVLFYVYPFLGLSSS